MIPTQTLWLRLWLVLGCASFGVFFPFAAKAHPSPASADSVLVDGFRNPPNSVRTRLFWRVFGPAWTPDEIDFQLGIIKDAGVGGVMTFFMYPVEVDGAEVHNQRFLSAEFLGTLKYGAAKARQLGLRFGVAGGTGWPFGGPSVEMGDAAQQLRQIVVKPPAAGMEIEWPQLRKGEQILAVFSGTNDVTDLVLRKRAKLPGAMAGEPLGFFVTGPTGMQVKRAALGAEGLVVDHYNTAAAERYLDAVVAPMLRAAPGLFESIFCDSLEVYRGNWTGELPALFRQMRRRSLAPILPEVFNSTLPGSADARFDFWRTLSEAAEARFTRPLSEWSHRHGVQLEMEAYGTPPNPLTAARYIDVPAGEQYEWRGFSLSRLASSGAHLAGRRIIGAEAWTWMGLPNRLGDSLSDAKLCSDLHYLAGVNDLTGVDFAYSPRSAGAPGWLPYYGPCFNQNNPQWPWFKHLVTYTSRCQWLLRQGRPVADVALYLPVEDKFAQGSPEQMALGFELRDHFVSGPKTDEFGLQTALHHHSDLIDSLFACGLNYDGIDFFTMIRSARVLGGHLLTGDGDYSVLVLPRVVGIESMALEKMAAFCRSGGTVLVTGRLPEHIFGPLETRLSHESNRCLASLFGEHPSLTQSWTRKFGRGRVVFVPDEQASLRRALKELQPDLLLEPARPEVGFVHRQVGLLDLYFLANTSDQPRSFQAVCRTGKGTVEAWDALTGEIHPLTVSNTADGLARVPVALPPRGSIFLVFGRPPSGQPEPEFHWQSEEITAPWTLSFPGADSASKSLNEPLSWTKWPEFRFYSGTATYTCQFTWSHPLPRRALVAFSQVHEVADVSINGASAGAAWTSPYEVDITKWLKPGTNTMAVTVANLPLNRFLGAPDQDLAPLRARYGNRFPAPEEKRIHPEPAPSGLTGPVQIRFVLD